MEFEKITPAEVRAEATDWSKYLNEIVGILCFSFGLAAASTANPAFYSFMSLLMIVLIHVVNLKKARLLRSLQKEKNKSEYHREILKDYFSYVKWHERMPGIFGYCFLSLIFTISFLADTYPRLYQFLFGA